MRFIDSFLRDIFRMKLPGAMSGIKSVHLAIRQFFEARGLEEWERCLRHVLFFALSTDDPDEGGCKEDTLYLYNSVCELVAACWVVRQNPLLFTFFFQITRTF